MRSLTRFTSRFLFFFLFLTHFVSVSGMSGSMRVSGSPGGMRAPGVWTVAGCLCLLCLLAWAIPAERALQRTMSGRGGEGWGGLQVILPRLIELTDWLTETEGLKCCVMWQQTGRLATAGSRVGKARNWQKYQHTCLLSSAALNSKICLDRIRTQAESHFSGTNKSEHVDNNKIRFKICHYFKMMSQLSVY